MAKEAKTNAMRMLDRQKVKYEAFPYECDEHHMNSLLKHWLWKGKAADTMYL